MNTINWKNTLAFSGPVLCGLALKLVKKKIEKQSNGTINEVLLYGEQEGRRVHDVGAENLFCIYYVVAHATRTVDVCVPSLDSEAMAKCLITVHQKKRARVRIAIHNSDRLCKLNTQFFCTGIEVKVMSAQRLQHEFILLDAGAGATHALALLGSLDYDTARVNCNRDMTVLTSEPTVVSNLKREFDRIWDSTPDLVRPREDRTT